VPVGVEDLELLFSFQRSWCLIESPSSAPTKIRWAALRERSPRSRITKLRAIVLRRGREGGAAFAAATWRSQFCPGEVVCNRIG
jgi:hypothetical protein